MEMLYCIKHEKMAKAERLILGHLEYIYPWCSLGYPMDTEVDFCEFEQGFAYCPPPEFDMDLFMQQDIKATVDEDFLPYDYDVLTDQIVEVVL